MGIHVPLGDSALAAREIERLGQHPQVVCVLISAAAHRIPLGNRYEFVSSPVLTRPAADLPRKRR